MGRYSGGKLVFDGEHTISYGFFRCPECSAKFYGGGPALHEAGCSKIPEGYEPCEYHFGAKELVCAIAEAADPSTMRDEQRKFLERVERTLPKIDHKLKMGRKVAHHLWNEAIGRRQDDAGTRIIVEGLMASSAASGSPIVRLATCAELSRLLEHTPYAVVST